MADKSVEAILASLTLDEKLSLLAGGSQWRTAAIDRVSVPNLKVQQLSGDTRDVWTLIHWNAGF